VRDNVLVGPEDFTQFSMTVPSDPRLPGGGGYTVSGLYNIRQEKFGQEQFLHTLSDKYGKQIEHWDGFDIGVNMRLENGLVLQGGVGTGKTTADNCDIVDKIPEALLATAATRSSPPPARTSGCQPSSAIRSLHS
jgi:hypothetical protein